MKHNMFNRNNIFMYLFFFVKNCKIITLIILLFISILLILHCCQCSFISAILNIYNKKNIFINAKDKILYKNNIKNNVVTHLDIDSLLMDLQSSKILIDKNLFNAAETYLYKALQKTTEPNLKSLIKIRIARINLQQNKINEALKILEDITMPGWISLAEYVKGDAYALQGNYKLACLSYKQAYYSDLSTLSYIKLHNLIDIQ